MRSKCQAHIRALICTEGGVECIKRQKLGENLVLLHIKLLIFIIGLYIFNEKM